MHPRIEREKRVVELMIKNFCLDIHKQQQLCSDCSELIDYAEKRLLSCPYIENKPVCVKCTIHCYNKQQQEKIKQVMRTVGPKMIYKHPWDTLWYFFYKFTHKYQKIA
ncbi:nitrous oxide-stimulated promoter family protein [Bacteroidota bacterium]